MKDGTPPGTSGGGSGQLHPAEFRSVLSGLKDGGCNLLVTGEVGTDVTDAMSRRLLGAPDHPRERVVVLADRPCVDADRILPEGIGVADPGVVVVDHSPCTRDGTTASRHVKTRRAPGTESTRDGAAVGRTGADRLQQELCATFADLETAAGGFEPAELRLALVSLRTLLDRYGEDAVERLVRGVRAHVAGVAGMAHYHLPLADDAAAVRRLAPLFDARIELRVENGLPPEQRWHLPGEGYSPWIRI